MAERIFISYRSADGRDKATALARELGRSFGAAQVFLDKDDLRGGSAWRDAVARTLHGKPVLLLLVTPQLLGPRAAAPDDPVRRELEGALARGATVIPVLCDGVDAVPDAATLPPPFDRLGALTWRRLRAYDWERDVERLEDDLRALGVAPAGPGRRLALAGAAGLGLVGLFAGGRLAWQRWNAGPDLAGAWQATLVRGERALLHLSAQPGDRLAFVSEPVPVGARADWADYRAFWLERTGSALDAIEYRGRGPVTRADPRRPALALGFEVLALPGSAEIDTGRLTLQLADDGRLVGRIWVDGERAEWPASLEREPLG